MAEPNMEDIIDDQRPDLLGKLVVKELDGKVDGGRFPVAEEAVEHQRR